MNYSVGAVGLAAPGAALAIPGSGPVWLMARILLDSAGALFACYLIAGAGLSLAGRLMRARACAARSAA